MSEIKVGDKVRVVQIAVKELDTEKHTRRRMSYLGGVGEVTCISPRLPSAIHVQLKQCLVTHVFDPVELELLSVPCGDEKADERVSCLREELNKLVANLYDSLREKDEAFERLRRSRKELQEQYEELIGASATMRVDIRNILNAAQRT